MLVTGEDIVLDEVVEAVRQCGNRHTALLFLQQECMICYCPSPASKVNCNTGFLLG